MNISLYINGIRRNFSMSAGWFSGNEFALFSLSLFEKFDNWISIIDFKIAKLSFTITIDEYEESMRDFDKETE